MAIDCADPEALAGFWCAVLAYEILAAEEGLVNIGPPGPTTVDDPRGPVPPTLTFARVPEIKSAKNRLHLDLRPADGDQDGEVDRLLGLGARRVDVGQTGQESWVCLADPEGNEFCVLGGHQA